MSRHPLRASIPTLRMLVPLAIGLAALGMGVAVTWRGQSNLLLEETDNAANFLGSVLSTLNVEMTVDISTFARMQSEMQILSLDSRVEHLLVLDSASRVRFASQPELVGAPADSLAGFDAVSFEAAVRSGRLHVLKDPANGRVTGYLPLRLAAPGALQTGREGLLYGSLDLRQVVRYRRVVALNQMTRVLTLVVALALLITAIMEGLVTGRLRAVMASMQRLAAGDLTSRTFETREDEIGIVGRTFNEMADRMEIQHRELAQSQAQYREVVEGTDDLVAVTDSLLRVVFVNQASTRFVGLSPDQCLGRSAFGFIHPDDRSRVTQEWDRIVTERIAHPSIPFRMVHSNGTVREILLNARIHFGEDGSVHRVQGIARDLTALLSAEREERTMRSRLEALFQGGRDAILILDVRSEKVIDSNREAESLFARPREALVGASRAELLGRFPDTTSAGSVDEGSRRMEIVRSEVLRPDGSHVPVEIGAIAVALPNGEQVLQAVFRDLREKRQLEERLLHVEKMSVVGQLAGGIAHDFNNQLTGILGFAELLAARLTDPSLKSYAERIQQSAHRSADLTRQLLAFSRKGKYREEPVDMHDLIGEVVAILRHSLHPGINIRFELHADPARVLGDTSQLQNALLNLALNARDAMPEGGELVFETRTVSDTAPSPAPEFPACRYLRIAVNDTGTGMDRDTLERAVEPFFTTKSPGSGTGLGLAAVFGTATHHKGTMHLESTLGRGTTCTLWLPLLEHDFVPAENMEASSGHGSGRRILVVDDEPTVRDLLKEMLELAGFVVHVCADGVEAVEAYRQASPPFDLVLLDLIMPRMGGPETMVALQALDPTVRILLLSGYAPESVSHDLLAAGACGFVAKPCERAVLIQQIASILDLSI